MINFTDLHNRLGSDLLTEAVFTFEKFTK